MKRNLMAVILALCLLGTSLAGAQGLLPSLADSIGKPMPSLGEALGRYPDEEIPEADGGNTEVFRGVTETDFNTFSVYLSEKGATLADYQTAGSSFSASIQVEGKTISFSYDTQTLEARVTYPKGTYDEWLDYAKTQLKSVTQLLNEGKAKDALSILLSIPAYDQYKVAISLLSINPELAASEAKLKLYKTAGAYVTFGTYPQTSSGTDQTAIEWQVLEYDAGNDRSLLISRYGLDAKPYNTEETNITWEKCTLRTWLNKDFMNKAFSSTEQSAILTTAVDNSSKQGYSGDNANGGNNTQDKVFLLSYAEANKYLGVEYWTVTGADNNTKSRVAPTAYAIKQGAYTSIAYKAAEGTAAGWWWLRSPGFDQLRAAYVYIGGSLMSNSVDIGSGCVRPALWINLKSNIF